MSVEKKNICSAFQATGIFHTNCNLYYIGNTNNESLLASSKTLDIRIFHFLKLKKSQLDHLKRRMK